MSEAVTSYFGSLPFIKYLRDDVTGTAFMDILELGGCKTEVIMFCSIKKSLTALPGRSFQKCWPRAGSNRRLRFRVTGSVCMRVCACLCACVCSLHHKIRVCWIRPQDLVDGAQLWSQADTQILLLPFSSCMTWASVS